MKVSSHKNKELKKFDKEILRLNFTEGDVPSLHPGELVSVMRGVTLGKYLFEGLTRLNSEGKYELAGAESVEISSCKTRYTFTLRPNFYSDGTPVVAYDYERFWKECLKPDAKCFKAHLFYAIKHAEEAKKGNIAVEEVGVKALDEKTLLVELSHPTPYFLGLLSSSLFAPFKVKDNEVLFSGPYLVHEWKKGDYLALEANPHFWDHAQTSIKKVKIFMVQDVTTTLSMYEKGEIDWLGDPFCWLSSEIVSSEVAKGRLAKETEIMCPFWLNLNTEYFPLSSPLIRKALSCVVNRNEIAEHVFIGDDPLFIPLPYEGSLREGSSDNEIEKGKELFEKGLKELGLTRETFPPLKLSSCGMISFKKLAEYLQEKWQAVFGIQVDLDVQEWHAFYANIASGNYQVGGYFLSSDYNDPLACLETLAWENNYSKWQNLEYRQIINQLKRESDIQKKQQLLRQAEELLKQEMPIIWLVNRNQYHGYRSDLKGLCFDQKGLPDLRWASFD